jgi:hypothetical protein
MTLPHATAFALLAGIPALVGLTRGGDGATRGTLIALLIIVGVLGAAPYVGSIDDLLNGNLVRALAVASLVLAVVGALRVKQPIIGTLIITATSLLTAWDLGLVG